MLDRHTDLTSFLKSVQMRYSTIIVTARCRGRFTAAVGSACLSPQAVSQYPALVTESSRMHHGQAMSDLQLYLFGAPRLVWQGRTLHPDRRKAVALLAFLAMAEQRHSRDHLAALLWPELDQLRARAALRSTSYALTALAPGAWLE